jgi:2,4-dienoyl-CoA reductase-like NADH-dependent reductase (Old Yellow Enzyme family)/NADPH-dependent 2,4-dienoyl-CoA reductase/sulfur reductase-like enzyme
MEMKYPRIFEPIKLGNVYFKNRIFASPTGHHEMSPDCFPDSEVVGYYEVKAKGGVAAVGVGDCIVHTKTGQSHVKQIHLDDPLVVPQLTAVAAAISRHGSVAAAELSHGGKYSHVPELVGGEIESPPFLRDGSGITYGPVADRSPSGHPILEMPEDVIIEIIESFGRGAQVARLCGFTMVTIHGGHGWLLSQFMNDKVNKRKDRWGGSFENRMRFTLAVIESIRRRVGNNFPIEFRMSGDECFEGGYHIDYGVKIAKELDGKVDLIHVSTGNHEAENGFVITHPNIFLDEGVNVKFAAEIKKHVATPVATVGALSDPALMEEILATGKADVVQIARQLLVDPEFVNKVRDGREDDAHHCLRCETCFSNAFSNRYHRCAINPRLGTYVDDKFAIPSVVPKRVLIAGGGIAGMQAALTAAEQGHEVILCEKTDRLGGVLNMERGIPFKFRIAEYLDRQARKVARAKIDVRLNTEVTPALAKELNPDAILVCAGAEPVVPKIKGIKGANVLSAEQVAEDPTRVGKRVVVIGAGFVGLETAIWLAMRGHKVSVVEMRDKAENGNTIHHVAVGVQLTKYGIPVVLSTKAKEITSEGLIAKGPDGKDKLYKADTVIYAAGQRPLWKVADALADAAPWVNVIGDARSPRVIADATREAYYAVRDIGAV